MPWMKLAIKTNSFLHTPTCDYIMYMKVGDIVLPKNDASMVGVDYGYGIIIDSYESDDGMVYWEVAWPGADKTWWHELELELVSESQQS